MTVTERAIKLIRAHVAFLTVPIQKIADGWQRSVQALLAEAEESDQFNDLFNAVLAILHEASRPLYTATGMDLITAALNDLTAGRGVGGIDTTTGDHMAAAKIIDAHSWFTDTDLEGETRGSAAADFDREIAHVWEWERQHQTLLAVIEIWYRLAPMLHDTDAGTEMIERAADE